MIALILAAGYATRLYPLTIDTPKPLLPVQGSRTILDLLAARLEVLEEISEILIVTNERFFMLLNSGPGSTWGASRSASSMTAPPRLKAG